MIDNLFEDIKKKVDHAEILCIKSDATSVNFYNYQSLALQTKDVTEVSLRVIKDGKIGEASGTLTDNYNDIINSALLSCKNGGEAKFIFDGSKRTSQSGKIYDETLANLKTEEILNDGQKIMDTMRKRIPEINLNLFIQKEIKNVSILNTSGKDDNYKMSIYTICLMHMFEGSKQGIDKDHCECRYFKWSDEMTEELVEDYYNMLKPVNVPKGKMEVIFRPSATWSLLFRLLAGVSGENVVKGITPLKDKIGVKIFHESFNAYDDPTLDWAIGSVPFDDEGVPTYKKTIVENGVLKNFIFDMNSGAKYGKGSSGNGFKRSMWARGIEMPPTPRFTNLVITPGNLDYKEMVKNMKEGLIVNDVIGFHSGNMLQGEFSMNIGIGMYVKDGKVQGRAIDTMVAGNIYEDFLNIKGMSNKLEYNPQAYTSAIDFEKMSVSGKG